MRSRPHSGHPLPERVRLATVALQSGWAGSAEHFHQTDRFEPLRTSDGCRGPFLRGCQSFATVGCVSSSDRPFGGRRRAAADLSRPHLGQPLRLPVLLAGVARQGGCPASRMHLHQYASPLPALTSVGPCPLFLSMSHSLATSGNRSARLKPVLGRLLEAAMRAFLHCGEGHPVPFDLRETGDCHGS